MASAKVEDLFLLIRIIKILLLFGLLLYRKDHKKILDILWLATKAMAEQPVIN